MNGGTVKTQWCAACLVIALAGIASRDLLACGDKFLVPSRGLRFELTPSAREQARILLYMNPASSLPGLFARLSLDAALHKSGYRAAVASDAEEVERLLRQGTWDVVLLDLIDGQAGSIVPPPGGPAVLAVAVNQRDSDLSRAKKQYAAILKSPTRSQAVVDALDVAVVTRRAAQSKASKSR